MTIDRISALPPAPVPGAPRPVRSRPPTGELRLLPQDLLPVAAIERAVRAIGIPYDRQRFLADLAATDSSWRLAGLWIRSATRPITDTDAAQLGQAATELWRRLSPDRPCIEMVEDDITGGYRALDDGLLEHAAELWFRAWNALAHWLDPATTRLRDLDGRIRTLHPLAGWADDLRSLLRVLARAHSRHADSGLRLCDQWLARFPDEPPPLRVPFLLARALFLLHLQRPEEARSALDDAVRRHPDNPWTHVALADALSHYLPDEPSLPKDLPAAVHCLLRGRELVPPDAPGRSALEDRLRTLRPAAA